MRRNTAPTLRDVAREAGATTTAASVVLNGATSTARIAATTRARILDAAARLRYRRNAVALGLTRSRMNTIAVVATIDNGDINLYFVEVLNGILVAAAERGQSAKVFSVRDWRTDEARLLEMCDGSIDGMILIAPTLSGAFEDSLAQCTRFVGIHMNSASPSAWNLDIDNEEGAYTITGHLIAQGHRQILHFAGPPDLLGPQQRIAGFRRALCEAGIPFDPSLVIAGEFNIESGRRRMEEVLDGVHPAALPSAVVCASDAIAYGAMEVLAERGVRVPEDMSIVGFDDTMMARMAKPTLTTMRQPFRAMGQRAVELLLNQIEDEGPLSGREDQEEPSEPSREPRVQTKLFAVSLIVRESTGPPRFRSEP